MKIVWLTDTPLSLTKEEKGYNGRGWIESELELLKDEKSVTIKIIYNTAKRTKGKQISSNIHDQPSNSKLSFKIKFFNALFRWFGIYESNEDTKRLKNIIEDFEPDLIHLFGTEWYGLNIIKKTNIPIVVHLQGISVSCYNAFLSPGFSNFNLLISGLKKPLSFFKANSFFFYRKRFQSMANREIINLPYIKYYLGRTDWDKSISRLFSPNSQYFHLDEILREPFYLSKKWEWKACSTIKIISTISDSTYKGLDLIYKCASILSSISNIPIHWNVCGIEPNSESVKLFKKHLRIHKGSNVCVEMQGIVSCEELIDLLQDSCMYIHPSYIDNSPNSVCEAQYIGVPVIATDVGGVSSIVKKDTTGILVPANDPYLLASKIIDLFQDKEKAILISNNAISHATARHDKMAIKQSLLKLYEYVCNNNNF